MGDTLTIGTLLRLVISLAILVGALYGVKHWQRRGGNSGRRSVIDVVARTSLGRNSAVHIIDVGDRRFLIGTAEQQVNLLSELEQPPHDEVEELDPLPAAGDGGTRTNVDPDGSGVVTRSRPRIGLMQWLRTITVRTPQRVRVIRGDTG